MTALHTAANNDRPDNIAALLAAGADVEARDFLGNTPLYWAADRDHCRAAEQLLAHGADMGAENNSGISVEAIAGPACQALLRRARLADQLENETASAPAPVSTPSL